jgi:succinyl-CoA synthetase beta subunit
MKVHEYQGKEILRQFGVETPRGTVAFSVDEAVAAAEELGGSIWVVKAQIHAGGRGKGGGVKLARSIDEVRQVSDEILGMQLVTHQTGPAGQKVRRIYVEEGCDIARELYVGMLLDRDCGRLVMMASTEGGMDIEKVAEETPEKIFKVWIDPAIGFGDYQARQIAFALGLKEKKQLRAAVKFFKALYTAYVEYDCSLAEINPLVVTGSGDVIALDAKLNFDDNALFRHPDVLAMRDVDEEDPSEVEAGKFDLSFIKLDGNVGCMVNGAGLAMATMDTIKLFGGEPANFLDVGGGATTEKVKAAFAIITSEPEVKAIFVNIFGGIMKCDIIAEGVIAAVAETGLQLPLVVRLEGTNVDLGKQILAESGLNIIAVDTMAEGAKASVAAAAGN